MFQITSAFEKRLWIGAFVVTAAIYSTLFLGRPFLELFGDQNIQAILFLTGMFLVGLVIVISGVLTQKSKVVFVLYFGILAVYFMLFLRLGLAERSHVIEYSVLAILIYNALKERQKNGIKIRALPFIAMIVTFIIGVLDECLQLVIPDRHFDFTDILFNGMVIVLAILSSLFIYWLRGLLFKRDH